MELWTIKQLAEDQHVSYEAIRKQLVRYRKELEGHIIRKKQSKLLDQYAVDYLKKRRRQSPVVVINQDRTALIDDLQAQLDAAKNEVMGLQKQLLDYQAQDKAALETAIRYEALLEDHKRTQDDLDQTRAERDQARDDLRQAQVDLATARATVEQTQLQLELARVDKEQAEQEAASFHRSLFGFYRKG